MVGGRGPHQRIEMVIPRTVTITLEAKYLFFLLAILFNNYQVCSVFFYDLEKCGVDLSGYDASFRRRFESLPLAQQSRNMPARFESFELFIFLLNVASFILAS